MERGSIQRPPDPGICFVTRVEGHLQTLVRIAKVTFSREQRRQWPAADFARALPLERRGWSLSPSMSSSASSPTASGPTGRRSPRLAAESCSTRKIKSASSSASSPTTGPAAARSGEKPRPDGMRGCTRSVQPCGVGWTGCGPVRGSGPRCSTGTLRGGSGPTALAWPIVGRVSGAACASVLLQVWAASAPESAVAFEYSLYPMLIA